MLLRYRALAISRDADFRLCHAMRCCHAVGFPMGYADYFDKRHFCRFFDDKMARDD